MSVSRMKNLIILVLSICAVCLLAVAVPNRLSQTHEQRRMLAELKTLYESYGLRIELDELPRSPTLYSVELSESGAQTAAQALLGQKAAQPDGGESVAALARRVRATVERLVRENPGRCIALFSHALPIRSMGCVWQGIPISEMERLPWSTNAAVSEAVYLPDGSVRFLCYGYDLHQRGMSTGFPRGAV